MIALAIAAVLLAFFPAEAMAQTRGVLLDASLTATTSAKNIVFASLPVSYLQICNEASPGGNNIGINPTGTAAIGSAGTHTLFPGGCQTFETDQIPTGAWSVIGAGSTVVTVWYR